MAAKAQEISLEAGSKMAAAMKDVIRAAAGMSTFAVESARDLVQYMVRRGQMTADEAEKLIKEAEEAWSRKHRGRKAAARKGGGKARDSRSHRPRRKPARAAARRKPRSKK
jgi:hypothetical protein